MEQPRTVERFAMLVVSSCSEHRFICRRQRGAPSQLTAGAAVCGRVDGLGQQRLSVPHIAAQLCHWRDNWCTRDRDRTVSRRSEPSSRTALIGEQPNPWDRIQPQDAMSRHRGAKPPRRCGLLGEISLLSPG
ncbi:Cell wall-associated hydrolase [Trichuris trichiura]|uniref:Cell wall-associated hydrolase n=1 Tax=Trichuris trichiura TaxID=36087 RepID=A0A077ZLP9_TRITR|nr:Cell wall-associated hydrolase [Trichuris trichiura]